MSHDSELQQSVIEELRWEPSVTAAHIGVTANGGVIALNGYVQSYAEKHAAELAAGRVKGVRAVADELEVRLTFETERSDEEIAGAAIERLSWDVSIPRDAVQVRVERGWVTLTGRVDFYHQRELAQQEVRRLIGVVGVSDQISVRARVSGPSLRDDISHALHRSWSFDPQAITVTVEGSQVRLTGTVHTRHDRDAAAATAWAAHGVTGVENDLAIG